jgi:hypothetical protein
VAGSYYQMVVGVAVVHVHVATGQMVHQSVLNAGTVQNFMIGYILVSWHYLHLFYIGSLLIQLLREEGSFLN